MKAIEYTEYGSPDVLRLNELEKPIPKDNEVLIRVRAASVNPLEWHFMRGEPFIVRMEAGWFKPKSTRLGVDLAGVVEAVGKDVTLFKPGDEVFGGRSGALSEYVCTTGKSLVPKPANISFEQAASIAVAGCTALQGLRDKGQLQAGQKVLINGAAGGVGTFAVQIAKALGADVTGVCSTQNVEMVRSLGADTVIDYNKEDFTRNGQRYDLLIDNVGNHSISDCLRVVTPNGSYVMVGGSGGGVLGPMAGMLQTALIARFVSQKVLMFLATINKDDLTVLKELVEAGKLTPVVDRCYPLTETAEAIRYIETGHARGKVVVTVA